MILSDPWSTVHSGAALDADYLQGLNYARQDDWASALNSFISATARTDHFHGYYTLYSSAEGLAMVMMGNPSGLNKCRQAVLDDPKHADLYENLARACLRLKQRKKAVDAIAKGLRADSCHTGLNRLKKEIGFRRSPAIPFLSRDNPLNRFIGRRTYRR